MNIDLIGLKSGLDKYINIEEVIVIPENYFENTEIIKLSDIKVNGILSKDSMDNYIIDINIDGVMTLPCSVTLKEVLYPFSVNINGDLEQLFNEMGTNIKKSENSIDILSIIWENILMEIPIKVTSSDVSSVLLKGDGWKFVTGDEDKINPELEKLKDLL